MKWFQSTHRDQLVDPHVAASRFRQRTLILTLFALLLLGLLVWRLVYLQVQRHDHYATASTNNRVHIHAIAPERGLIFDRNGFVLAHNLPSFQLEIIREDVNDLEQTLREIARYIPFSDGDVARFRKAMQHAAPFQGVALRHKLSEREVAAFSVVQHQFPGVEIVARLRRHYPQNALAGHTIGYVGRIDEREKARLDRANYRATRDIGKIGIERQFESLLHGQVGHQQVEVNVEGRVLRVLEEQAPREGAAVYLTLDTSLQRAAEEALGEHSGAIVALDPQTGEILAMVSKPAFDNNLFVGGISVPDYAALRDDWRRPLFNRALSGTYPPGSTLKPIMALGSLEAGVVNTSRKIYCPGYYRLPNDDHRYRDWKKNGHGFVNLEQAIVESCDVMFYDLSHRMGIDRIAEFFDQFGFGRATGIDLAAESVGILPDRAWKQRHYGQMWYPGETLIAGIGQGYFTATPLQIVNAMAMLATRGQIVQPHLLYAVQAQPDAAPNVYQTPAPDQITLRKPSHWDYIHKTMWNSTRRRRGTAYTAFKGTDYHVAGKTGTAQVFSVAQDAEYDKEQVAKRLRDHALFAGFAPLESPELAVVVIVENGGSGGAVAAPIARQIFDAWLTRTPSPVLSSHQGAETVSATAAEYAHGR